MKIKSSAFREGDVIPSKYTCDGDDVNPFLEIRGVSHEAKSLVLIVDDPDATSGGVWDHWIVWNINPKTQYIGEDTIPHGSVEGKNSFGSNRYGGPCPPHGNKPHRYRFKIYALDTLLDIPVESGRVEVENAMKEHILDKAEVVGLYGRE